MTPVLGGPRSGTPAAAGLATMRVAAARDLLVRRLPPYAGAGCYPSAVLLLARDGVVGVHEAYGDAVRYGADGGVLPAPRRVPAQTDTVYDLASVTKTVTAVTVLVLVERGELALDQPVRELLPAFTGADRAAVTVRQLLAHTSGLPATINLWRQPAGRRELLAAVARVPLRTRPGAGYEYSDLGPMLAGAIVEHVTGGRLDEVVHDLVTGPLGMVDTGYLPDAERRARCAATEAQPWAGRPLVRGEVHDENAWALGGVAGHAGLFGTAADVAVLAHALVTAGDGSPDPVLRRASVEAMLTDHGAGNGLGVDLNRPTTMGALASASTAGHAGFTGTSYVLDTRTRAVGVLLTNRVHPTRDGGKVNESRARVAEALLPVTDRVAT